MFKRKVFYGVPNALEELLMPLGLKVFEPDIDTDDTDSDEAAVTTDWIHNLVVEAQKDETNSVVAKKPPRKIRRRWRKRAKMPYRSSMFYRDFHNRNVQDLGHRDAKEFRLNYRMPWADVDKLVKLFVEKKWVVAEQHAKGHYITGCKVCPPEIKILGTLYWLGEGCSFRTIHNLSGRVLTPYSFNCFAQEILCADDKLYGAQVDPNPKQLGGVK
jgi:hypothetical protein